jgi:uncharacterized protein DUF3641
MSTIVDVERVVNERYGQAAQERHSAIGYGIENSGLVLNLVYNPVGAFLPPPEKSIEADFKRELMDRYGISFNQLFTITNMPIKRFLDYLRRSGNEERYMQSWLRHSTRQRSMA